MPITINGNGTIGGISVGGLPDGTVDTDTIADAAVTAAKRGAGAILQVVEGNTSTEVSNSTTTYVDTGLSATITPISTTSKVLVVVDQQCRYSRTDTFQGVGVRLYRDATLIYDPISIATGPFDDYVNLAGVTSVFRDLTVNLHVLDSPSTTSAVTYKTQGRPYQTTGNASFQVATTGVNGSSRIILMEVAA